jgi:uncharacterized protein (TIGR00255 family)
MSINSMTGFARAEGSDGRASWHWEARCVNNRGFDLRLRLPPGYDALEAKVREAAGRRFTRGSINISLSIESGLVPMEVRLNEAALTQVVAAADRLRHLTGADPARADGLLALKGVLETVEKREDEGLIAARHRAMLASLETALDGLAAARRAEGARLEPILVASVAEIERLTGNVAASPSRTPEAIRARLAEQIERLVGTGAGLDPDRLHQEAVLIATRADVEEEVKRLVAHVEAARELLSGGGAVGRKLDFLAQELNREATTLTSKANGTDVARAGLALKVVIDQLREQVQNIE